MSDGGRQEKRCAASLSSPRSPSELCAALHDRMPVVMGWAAQEMTRA
jgi:hypothetical protein